MKTYTKPGNIYFSDNGALICHECAGGSAKFTGRDLSGQRISKATKADADEWLELMGETLKCECGKTAQARRKK